MCREERQGGNDKDDNKSHDSECHGICLQHSGTFGDIVLLGQQTCDSHLPEDGKKTAENQNQTARIVPEPGIISQAFKARTVIGRTGCVFIKHFTQSMITGIIQPAAFAFYKLGGVNE